MLDLNYKIELFLKQFVPKKCQKRRKVGKSFEQKISNFQKYELKQFDFEVMSKVLNKSIKYV
jgi:hypothetical protein